MGDDDDEIDTDQLNLPLHQQMVLFESQCCRSVSIQRASRAIATL